MHFQPWQMGFSGPGHVGRDSDMVESPTFFRYYERRIAVSPFSACRRPVHMMLPSRNRTVHDENSRLTRIQCPGRNVIRLSIRRHPGGNLPPMRRGLDPDLGTWRPRQRDSRFRMRTRRVRESGKLPESRTGIHQRTGWREANSVMVFPSGLSRGGSRCLSTASISSQAAPQEQ
jgi:hypothetical protein